MRLINDHINDIKKLCSNHRVKQLYVFGSVLGDNFTSKSDIDFLVAFDKMDFTSYADNYYDLKFGLENILHRPVDLLEENALRNPFVRKNIEQKRQLVYGY